jgi:short-subunit dehydrogenase
MKIADRRILLTGASSGLGAALAREFARRGARCALAARRVDLLEELADEIAAAHGEVARPLVLACDVTDRASVAAAVAAAARGLGRIDVLVNNAGISAYGATARSTEQDLADLLDVNLLGGVRAMRAVLPHLERQGGGVIVNVASTAAIRGVPYLAAYGASKAALAAYSQSLRAEVARRGVRVQVIYPGYTETPIFDHERKFGGARRPRPPYTPAARVARRVVTAIGRGRSEVVLGASGRWLAFLHGCLPGLVDRIMTRLAGRLGESEVNDHASTQTADHRVVPESRS